MVTRKIRNVFNFPVMTDTMNTFNKWSVGLRQLSSNVDNIQQALGTQSFTVESGITAIGITQTAARLLTKNFNYVLVPGPLESGVKLQPIELLNAYGIIGVYNSDAASSLTLYPAEGESLNFLAANTGVSIPPGTNVWCVKLNSHNWLVLGNSAASYLRLTTAETNILALQLYATSSSSTFGGWWDPGATVSYISASSINCTGGTTSYPIGTKVQINQAGTLRYGYVTGGTGSTLTLLMDTAITNAAMGFKTSMMDKPYGFPDYITYASVSSTGDAGLWTETAMDYFKVAVSGKRVSISMWFHGVQTLANSNYINFTNPFTAANFGNNQYHNIYVQEAGVVTGGHVIIQNNASVHRVYKQTLAQFAGGGAAYAIGNFFFFI